MNRATIGALFLAGSCILMAGCAPEFDKCVEAKQDAYKREHPDENWENLVRAREQFEAECRQ